MEKEEKFASKISLGDRGSFSGVAMTVGVPDGKPYYNFTEKSLQAQVGKKVKLMVDHDQYTSSQAVGTAEFKSFDGKRLMFDAQLLMEAKDIADNVYPRVKAGILDAVSVGVIFEDMEEQKNGKYKINEFNIKELSIVTFPAFSKAKIKSVFNDEEKITLKAMTCKLFEEAGVDIDTSISFENLKSLTKRDFETILKEIGFSNDVATKLSSVQGELGNTGQGELDMDLVKTFLTEKAKGEEIVIE